MIDVLAVASEVFPLIKTGGLADVVGSLPAAVRGEGIDMKTMVPGYPSVLSALDKKEILHSYDNLFDGPANLVGAKVKGLDLIVLDAPHLFHRDGNPYLGPDGKDWPDNWKRFAALSFAAADVGRGAIPSFVPRVIHAHDWQTGLIGAYGRFAMGSRAKTVMTIHNLAFQGHFPASIFGGLWLPAEALAIDGVEYYGGVGFLKAGLQLADWITTVSPTYAEEICTPAGGMGLDGLLNARRDILTGIVNGADIEIWNPETDASLASPYTTATLQRRTANKREIERHFSLELGDGPLFAVVSRLTWQKGMDLLGDCVDGMVARGARLALLGSGDAALEGLFRAGASRHPGRVGVITTYDEPLSHLLQGGADAILIPSRFEPCGLTQFYGLRYGCVPVVSHVGGLADTIIDANDAAIAAGVATGIQFFSVDKHSLDLALGKALRLYGDQRVWRSIQRRGMKADVSWSRGASRYAALYKLLAGKAP